MSKTCVFCGKIPEKKSREHIIPQWLIKVTGDINRTANFGIDFSVENISKGIYKPRIFSFSSFQFPACEECNTNFSILENIAYDIIHKIFDGCEISGVDVNDLLDWFDKIRVGLWLGYNALNKNQWLKKPNFHISTRLGMHDRMLLIYRRKDEIKRLNFTGASELGFLFVPSCFLMCINQYYFINLSYQSLFSKKLGFPYIKNSYSLQDTNLLQAEMAPGLEKIQLPFIDKKMKYQGTEIYQPAFYLPAMKWVEEFYQTDYIRNHCMNFEKGMGNIFIPDNENEYTEYGRNDYIFDIGGEALNTPFPDNEMCRLTFELKLFLYRNYFPQNPIAENSKDKKLNEIRNQWKKVVINESENLILEFMKNDELNLNYNYSMNNL